ncbi:MAG: hypothetical protein RR054_06415 [Clostridia bacterium]
MEQWWQALTILQQIFFCIASGTTVITIIQTILLLIGFDGGDSTDIDVGIELGGGDNLWDIGSLPIFSIRGIIAGLCIGGWLGYVLLGVTFVWLSVILAIIAMAATMILYALALRFLMKMQQSGNIDVKNAIGKSANVYLSIPANRAGTGKINITIQERFLEFNAITDENEKLPTNSTVEVCDVISDGTVLVKRYSSEKHQEDK